ncbi:hypothetical protein HPB49_025659 [Dermacentor silvarum]|uniref:Uncharacterized protein n=1 Tax=Dermacentor silvarum TaxID=543639 RepID=A0ACB8DHT5_DERSI|nr:hypothetical protein HPB49_025659 [Dermacentor silvarum]
MSLVRSDCAEGLQRDKEEGDVNALRGRPLRELVFLLLTTQCRPPGHRYQKEQLETAAKRVGGGEGLLIARGKRHTRRAERRALYSKVCWAGGARDSNAFMDQILLQKMPTLVRSNSRLYPNVTIPEFKFKVEATRGINRDLKVKMKEGAIRGFDTGVHRTTDCNPPAPVAFNVSISCVLDFNGIYTTFLAKTEGDNLLGTEKRVPVNVTVVDTTGRFEATSSTGRAGIVRTFHIDRIRLRTTYGDNLHLNDARKTEFIRQIEEKVMAVLYDALYNDYMHLLNHAIDGLRFPNP